MGKRGVPRPDYSVRGKLAADPPPYKPVKGKWREPSNEHVRAVEVWLLRAVAALARGCPLTEAENTNPGGGIVVGYGGGRKFKIEISQVAGPE